MLSGVHEFPTVYGVYLVVLMGTYIWVYNNQKWRLAWHAWSNPHDSRKCAPSQMHCPITTGPWRPHISSGYFCWSFINSSCPLKYPPLLGTPFVFTTGSSLVLSMACHLFHICLSSVHVLNGQASSNIWPKWCQAWHRHFGSFNWSLASNFIDGWILSIVKWWKLPEMIPFTNILTPPYVHALFKCPFLCWYCRNHKKVMMYHLVSHGRSWIVM